MAVGGQSHDPAALPPGSRPGTPSTGGSRAGLDGCGKPRPPPGLDPRTVQPIGSRYTDRAIPARCAIIHLSTPSLRVKDDDSTHGHISIQTTKTTQMLSVVGDVFSDVV